MARSSSVTGMERPWTRPPSPPRIDCRGSGSRAPRCSSCAHARSSRRAERSSRSPRTTASSGMTGANRSLRGFRLNPAAMGVTGPVLNGSNNYRIDRANYLHTFGSCCPPMNKSQRKRCPPPANVAFRRTAIGPGPISAGSIELAVTPRLFNDQLICVHEGMTVTHVQSHGFLHTMLTHFDNGRSTTGLHRIPLSRRQLPWSLFRDTVRAFSPGARSTPTMRRDPAAGVLALLLSRGR